MNHARSWQKSVRSSKPESGGNSNAGQNLVLVRRADLWTAKQRFPSPWGEGIWVKLAGYFWREFVKFSPFFDKVYDKVRDKDLQSRFRDKLYSISFLGKSAAGVPMVWPGLSSPQRAPANLSGAPLSPSWA